MLKKILIGLGALLFLVAAGVGIFVAVHTSAYETSLKTKYDVPVPTISVSTDPAVLERGKHLEAALGGCSNCHGTNHAGGKVEKMGPIGTMTYPNITAGKNGALATYSDGELARLIRHGIRKDGTTVRFMPSGDYQWWPMDDLVALISYMRTLPPVDTGPVVDLDISPMGKVLDRLDKLPIDIARRIDHTKQWPVPVVAPTVEYGAQIAMLCSGCHGPGLSGGPIPGAPPSMPVPQNLTPHATGMKDWTFEDFDTLMKTGIRKNGQKCAEMMPIDITKNFNETELKALWAYLRSMPEKPFGGR